MTKQITTTNAAETEAIARAIGMQLKGGEVIELVSDLGGGKTTFTRGLAHGMGSHDHVASPTFMISRVYKVGRLELHHFDFYRLPEAGLIEHELEDILGDPRSVVVVEWSDVVQHVLPKDRLTIKIESAEGEARTLRLQAPESLEYLLEGVAWLY